MFDTYKRTEHVPYEKTVTVNEHRAPTDESVRLLREMEAAAARAVIGGFVTEGNALAHGAVIVRCVPVGDGAYSADWFVTVAFKLNGHDIQVSERFDYRSITIDSAEAARRLREVLAKAIENELAPLVLRELCKVGR